MLERLNSLFSQRITISTAGSHFKTAVHEEQVRLLVHTLSEEESGHFPLKSFGSYSPDTERQTGAMASRDTETKTSAIETHAVGTVNGSSYRKSTDDFGVTTEVNNGAGHEVEVTDAGVTREDLATAIQVIEAKKHRWYAYFTTKDFWAVLVLGYVLQLISNIEEIYRALLIGIGQ